MAMDDADWDEEAKGKKGKKADMDFSADPAMDALSTHLHKVISEAVWPAVQPIVDMEPKWTEGEICKRVVKYIHKAAMSEDLLSLGMPEVCKQIVESTMKGYTTACGDHPWYYHLDLVPALAEAAYGVLYFAGQDPNRRELIDEIAREFQTEHDKTMLERAMWDVAQSTFEGAEDKVHTKIFNAISRSYHPVFEEVTTSLDGVLSSGDPALELKNVEDFARKWMEGTCTRAWNTVDQSLLTEEAVTELFLRLVSPFGEDDPFTCMPRALIETIGTPPPNWPFVQQAVREMFARWGGGGKRRKTNGGGAAAWDEAPPPRPQGGGGGGMYSAFPSSGGGGGKGKAWADAAMSHARPSGKGGGGGGRSDGSQKLPGRGGGARKGGGKPAGGGGCGIGKGNPSCTSAEECIGGPSSRLVQHVVDDASVDGDIYCEPCWCTFVRRNPQLEGTYLDD